MRNLLYILPICLCCFAVLAQQQSGYPTVKTNAVPRSTVRQSQDPMLVKYKQNEGWVKLTAAIDRETVVAEKQRSEIKAQNDVLMAKHAANQDISNDKKRVDDLQNRLRPIESHLYKMKSQRSVIESQIRLREIYKQ